MDLTLIIKEVANAGGAIGALLALVIVVLKQLEHSKTQNATLIKMSEIMSSMQENVRENTAATRASTDVMKEVASSIQGCKYNK
jgi:hypothetical protein